MNISFDGEADSIKINIFVNPWEPQHFEIQTARYRYVRTDPLKKDGDAKDHTQSVMGSRSAT
jgi:hypothetical protein